VLLIAPALAACGGGSASGVRAASIRVSARGAGAPAGEPGSGGAPLSTRRTTTPAVAGRPPSKAARPFAVGVRVVAFVDRSRTVRYPGEAPQPRRIVAIVRYPAAGPGGRTDEPNAPPLRSAGRFPLIVFGHGFAVTPGIYAPLLRYWARAGYVVVAPIFPLGNANAPGGPNENDLVNQPRDMSFAITRMLIAGATPSSPFAGLIDPRRIAVSGQSDGADTALTAAYHSGFRDRRIGAAAILSGQEIPGLRGYDFPAGSPPLLATQGLADTINLPSTTFAFFDAARPPKYLLTLPGAPHLGPYTDEQPQLAIVERVTLDFLNWYLKREPGARARMTRAGDVPGIARLQAER
jgi:dienelactone hydrolase